MAGMRESTWLGARVVPSDLLFAPWHSHQICQASAPPPPPAASHPGSIHTNPRHTLHHKPSRSVTVLGRLSRQLAEYVLHKPSVAQNGAPHNSPVASTTGMTTPTTRARCREREDGSRPLRASRHLYVVKPTSHVAPADDSTPLPSMKKRKSPGLREEGIHSTCGRAVRLRCVFRRVLFPFSCSRLGRKSWHTLRRSRCERGARAFADTLPDTPQRIAPASPPLATSLHRVVSVAMCNRRYFLVR
ncbi:hypothetical protein DFH09DRAFT_1505816 [Mycena vulgaris]|nr:hypothetical protein DFH09DRAFT_1505816 [Mycena vulgaris]